MSNTSGMQKKCSKQAAAETKYTYAHDICMLSQTSPLPPPSETMARYVRESKIGSLISDTRRFEVYYANLSDVPTEKEFFIYLCRFTCAALNMREVTHCLHLTVEPLYNAYISRV